MCEFAAHSLSGLDFFCFIFTSFPIDPFTLLNFAASCTQQYLVLVLVKSVILWFQLLSLSCNKIDLYLRDERFFCKLSAARLFNSSHLENSQSKLEPHKVNHHLVIYLSEILLLISTWPPITTASKSLANFAVQHPNFWGGIILPVLERKCPEAWSRCPASRRRFIVSTLQTRLMLRGCMTIAPGAGLITCHSAGMCTIRGAVSSILSASLQLQV